MSFNFDQFAKVSNYNPTTGSPQVEFANFLTSSGSYYRTNRFFATLFPPLLETKALSDLYNKDGRGFRFVCEQATLPVQSLFTIDYKINNLPILKLPYTMDYGNELNLTFRMSKDYLERKFFIEWQDYIFNFKEGVAYYDDYTNTSSIILSQIDSTNNKIFNTQFIGVYPTTIGSIEYSWEADNNYVKQNISFSFYKMISEGVTQVLLAGHPDEIKNELQKSKDLFNNTTRLA